MTTNPQVIPLPNGIRIVVDHRPNAKRITCAIGVIAGSGYERLDEHGVAHFLEHMALKGHSKNIAAIEARGGTLSATTDQQHIMYSLTCFPEHFKTDFGLLADMVQNSTFTRKEFQTEKLTVLEEIRTYACDINTVLMEQLLVHCFPNDPFSRPILGTPQSLDTITPKILRAFHARHHTAHNTVVVVCGNVNKQDVVHLVEQHMSAMPKGAPVPATMEADYQPVDIRQKDPDMEQTHIRLAFPGSRNAAASTVLSAILSIGHASRLMQATRALQGSCYDIQCGQTSNDSRGLFLVNVATTQPSTTLTSICRALGQACTDIKPEEIQKTLNQARMHLIIREEGLNGVAEEHAASMLEKDKPATSAENRCAAYAAITAENVMQTARDIFSKAPSLILYGAYKKAPSLRRVHTMTQGRKTVAKKPAPAPKPPGSPA